MHNPLTFSIHVISCYNRSTYVIVVDRINTCQIHARIVDDQDIEQAREYSAQELTESGAYEAEDNTNINRKNRQGIGSTN